MKKNVASQVIGAQMVDASDGSAFTSTVTVYVTGDGGSQALGGTGSGVCTHEGNGFHTYVPTQAETNYDHVAFTFIGTGAIPATVQVYTTYPQSADAPTASAISDAIWDEAVAGHSTAATFGKYLVDMAANTYSTYTDWLNGGRLDLLIDAILADTNEIQGMLPSDSNYIMGSETTWPKASDIDAILADTNELQTDDTPGTLATIDGVVDAILAILDDARSEPGQGAPPVNPDLATKIDYLYKFLRNKVETTSTEIKVYDDAGSTVDHKSSISDNGTTFSRGEFATGP